MKRLLYDYVPCVYSHFLTHFQVYSLIFMEMYFKIRYCGLLFSYDIKLVFICVIDNGFSWCCIVSYGAQWEVALFPGLPWPPNLWWLAVWKNKSSLVPRPPFLFWEGSGNETKTSNQKLELRKAWEGGYPNGVSLSCRSRGSSGFFIILRSRVPGMNFLGGRHCMQHSNSSLEHYRSHCLLVCVIPIKGLL